MPYSSLRMIPILIVSIFVKLKILLLATAMIDGSTCHKIVIWRYRLTIFIKSLLFTLLSKNFMTFFNSSIMSDRIFVHTPGVPVGMWTCPHQVLAAILTLSQPGGGADCAQTILVSTPGFKSQRRKESTETLHSLHRRACTLKYQIGAGYWIRVAFIFTSRF